ncbi:MAG: alpha/beta hydrolase [Actinomycetota bacterium]
MQRIAVLLAVVVLGFVGLAWLFQRSMIYFPSRHLGPPPPGVHEATFTTSDGLELGGWFFAAVGSDGRAVLVCNGNAGNRSHRVLLAEALRDRGWSVLLYDYRGYGGNPGRPSEQGLAKDARAAVSWLADRDDVDADRIAYLGESLGGGVAAGLAAERPPAALVLRSPFTSLADLGRVHYPFLPVGALLRDRFPVVDHLRSYDGPVLVVGGEADTIVPPDHSAAVARAAHRSRHVVIPGADHNDPALLDGDEFIEAVVGFLAEHT